MQSIEKFRAGRADGSINPGTRHRFGEHNIKRRIFLQSSAAAAAALSIPTSRALAAALDSLSKVTGDTHAVSVEGAEITLEQAAVKELSDSLRGRVLLPGQEAYELARHVLNPTIDKHPGQFIPLECQREASGLTTNGC